MWARYKIQKISVTMLNKEKEIDELNFKCIFFFNLIHPKYYHFNRGSSLQKSVVRHFTFFFSIQSLQNGVYFTPMSHICLDRPHVKCSPTLTTHGSFNSFPMFLSRDLGHHALSNKNQLLSLILRKNTDWMKLAPLLRATGQLVPLF